MATVIDRRSSAVVSARAGNLVAASIIAGIVVNLIYVIRDPAWLHGLGDIVATTLGLVAMVRLWQVFPVDFADGSLWRLLARWVVAAGIVGSAIGIIAGFTRLVRGLTSRTA